MKKYMGTDCIEFADLEKELASLDFSEMSDKKRVYQSTQKRLEENHINHTAQRKVQKRFLAMAASFVLIGLMISQTTYAMDFVDYVIKLVMLGDSKVIQIESPKEATQEDYLKSSQEAFNQSDLTNDADVIAYTQLDDLFGKTSFDLKMPQYLPDGYNFERGEFYKQEDGSLSKDYVSLYYVNLQSQDEIILQGRVANADTDYVALTDGKVTEVMIHGVKAALINEASIQWSQEKVTYHLSCKGNLGKEELIKIAESIR